MSDKKFRLITRTDFDGIICGTLFQERDMVDEVIFAEPNDMQRGLVAVTSDDITANLPYREEVHLCFDHHRSELERVGSRDNLINDPDAPSAARVIYNHYGGKSGFPDISEEMMAAVDQADSAQYEMEDILAPAGWTMLNFILDPRTGLEDFGKFALDHDSFMTDMMTYCRHSPIDVILELPDVAERVQSLTYHAELAEMQIKRCTAEHGSLVVTDLRKELDIFPVNRFMIYALYPESSISMTVQKSRREGITAIGMGKSILNRTAKTDIGKLLLTHGGGGHAQAGGVKLPDGEADQAIEAIIASVASQES
ncbi:exopolyphosphatase [Aestuariispira insulae]|uniref:NanoRNase/pAp phosphatase (C-di-AMP/oligoRNAs hydrolase) n=1 Tax=Aestuariispira insulae TaxID=1461337 RepID=A0A3D9HGC9_9PROT|nr:exopolyphosphatase [Aestuariispira insulae]RED48537.1 nanoRNase/pAp phosphatase (c-di-AMP/oligoRNAs hydrolase) [Aestuariispira insulae]